MTCMRVIQVISKNVSLKILFQILYMFSIYQFVIVHCIACMWGMGGGETGAGVVGGGRGGRYKEAYFPISVKLFSCLFFSRLVISKNPAYLGMGECSYHASEEKGSKLHGLILAHCILILSKIPQRYFFRLSKIPILL